jgi:hypothetical protein
MAPALKNQGRTCLSLARVLSEGLSCRITHSGYRSNIKNDATVCTLRLDNADGRPKVGIGVILWQNGRIVVDVHEYRLGSCPLSGAANEIGNRVLRQIILRLVAARYPIESTVSSPRIWAKAASICCMERWTS